jgi:GH24 family phage-related lysozyme (muramidase)
VVLAHEQDQFAAGVTQAEATELLRRDVRIAERAVLRLISVPLTDGQFDALVSFTFNLGAGALQRSTLRRKVNRGEHEGVPAELMKWVWAAGKKLPGLVRRWQAEGVAYASAPLAGMKIESDSWGKPEQGDVPPHTGFKMTRFCR